MAIAEKQMEYEKVPTKELIYENEKNEVPPSFGYGIRHVQSLILFVCLTIGYIARAHLGVSVVAMTSTKHANAVNVTNITDIFNETLVIDNAYDDALNISNIIFTSNETDMFNQTEVLDDEFENALNISRKVYTMNSTNPRKIDNQLNDAVNISNKIFINNITDMTNETGVSNDELNTTHGFDPSNGENESIWNVFRKYDWPKPVQEMILDAFFFGYCLMMFPTGMICQRYGGKLPLQICLLVNGVVSFATPTVAVWGGWKAVCACRVLQGLSQSGLYPSAHTLLSKWVPISERASLSSYVYTGTLIGTVIAFQIGGLMADSSAGWPGTFWLTGALCIGAFVMLTVFGAASPADHGTISDEEKNFILGRIDDGKKKISKTPWKHIFRSKHVWATFASHISAGACSVFLFTQIPTYMHYILGFDVKSSGLLSSLPYVASALANIGFGAISDYCTNKGYVSLKTARRLCNTIAQAGTAVCLAALSFTENSTVAVILLIVGLGLFAGIHSGWMVNYIDLAPNFGGSLMAMGNTWATLGILTQPFLVSNIVTDVTNRAQWRILMFVMGSMIFVCNALFVVFMSVDPQPWNDINETEDIEKEITEKR